MIIAPHTLSPQFRLITFPVSHYCEKARWAFSRLDLPYIEERHAPLFHYLYTKRVGGKSVPILVAGEKCITDSTDILVYLDRFAPESLKLYPCDSILCEQVRYWEAIFNNQLGAATRLWAYSYTLHKPSLIKKRFTNRVPIYEKLCFPLVFPLVKSIINRRLNVNNETIDFALSQITKIFKSVAELLSNGQTYLLGDRFTAADLTFAALAAPIIRPPEYGDPALDLSNLEQLPLEMAQEIEILRNMSAGKYALKLWRDRTVSRN